MKRLVLFILIFCILIGCQEENEDKIQIATTTSIFNTGLLDTLIDDFNKTSSIKVEALIVGSGKAIELAKSKDVDLIIAHSPSDEEELVKEGHSLKREPLMYNYFFIVGPETLQEQSFDGIIEELREKRFISRGDKSGTHRVEDDLWDDKYPREYLETGKGMLDTLLIASELSGYTLTDNSTFLTNKDKLDNLKIAFKDQEKFKNEYAVHLVNGGRNLSGAKEFRDYLFSKRARAIIKNYKKDNSKENLYYLIGE